MGMQGQQASPARPWLGRKPRVGCAMGSPGPWAAASGLTVEMMGRSPNWAAQPRPTVLYIAFSASVPLRMVPSRWMA